MADKKITELPFITDITASIGSSPSNTTVIPVVLYGTTNQITADNLKDNFIRNVRGTVKDIQTYTSSLKGAVTVRGNGIEVAGNLEVQGNMSVKGTIFTQYETSSIIYTSGSTKFGNSFDDLHEFTGSVVSTGSYTINGEDYTFYSSSNSEVFTTFSSSNSTAITSFSSSNSTLFTNFSSSNSTVFTNYSSSESTLFTNFSSSNSSYNTTFSSSNETYVTALSSSNSSYNTTFSSSNSTYITALSSSNSSYNTTFSSSNATYVTALSSSNSSYNTTFSSSNSSYNTTFSSSNATYVTALSSSNSTTFTNYSSSTAGTINGLSSGVTNELNRVYQTTASLQDQTSSLLAFTASQVNRNTTLSIVTGSLNNFTASQDNRNFTLSQVTGSLIGITNGLMAFTASLDNTYATDAQLYQLYQATRSLELLSGSMIGITNGLMSFSASTNNSIVGVSAFTSSQLAVNLGTSIVTSSLNAFTASARIELNSIEAYTASLKAAAIVSSSTQISNYYKFAETASANTFYDTQTIQGNLHLSSTSPLLYNASNTNAMLFGFFDGSSIYGPYYQIFGSNYSNVSQRGSAEFVFDSRNSGYTGFNVAEFNGSTWLRKFRVSPYGAEVTGSLNVTEQISSVGITASILATNSVVSSSQQIIDYNKFALTASANTFYGTQSVTGSVKISGSIDDISYIDFDQKDSTTAVARLGWDTGEGTLTLGLSGGNLDMPIGVIDFETVYNADSSSISKGETVRISGAQGNRVAVKKAHSQSDDGSATILGLAAETIGVGAEGKVVTSGPLKGINTLAYSQGDLLWLGTAAGSVTVEKPQAPVHLIQVGVVQRVHASVGIINVFVQNGYEIDELHDVRITTASLAYNQLLARSGSVWRNETIGNLGIAVTGSNTFIGTQTISGSLLVSGSTLFSGTHTLSGTNTITGNTVLSGSIIVSGSSDFKNSVFVVTGSSHFTGSHFVDGVSVFSGSIYISSGSSYYRAGNKLFNYGQWCSLETQTGSANTAYGMKFETKINGSEGVYVSNNGSNFPTRIYVENTGMYNIQFSSQLHTTTAAAVDFSVWLSKDGTNITNSNSEYTIEIVAGGGFLAAARNFLEPITSGSYIELFWSATTANGELLYKGTQSTPTRPATPSCIVTVTQIA